MQVCGHFNTCTISTRKSKWTTKICNKSNAPFIADNPFGYNREDEDEDANSETGELLKKEATEPRRNIFHEENKQGSVLWKNYVTYYKYAGGVVVLIFTILLFAICQFALAYSEKLLSQWQVHILNQTACHDRILQGKHWVRHRHPDQAEWHRVWKVWCCNRKEGASSQILLGVYFNRSCPDSASFFFELLLLHPSWEKVASNVHRRRAQCLHELLRQSLHWQHCQQSLQGFSHHWRKHSFYYLWESEGKSTERANGRVRVYGSFCWFQSFFIVLATIVLIASVNFSFLIPSSLLLVALFFIQRYYIPTGRSLKRLEAASEYGWARKGSQRFINHYR